MHIDTSLLRERFTIREKTNDEEGKALEFNASSTRMKINLQSGELPPESFIVRAYNMHSCARMVSRIIADFEKNGPILSRKVDWEELWDGALNSYERLYNQHRWVAVYHQGKAIFSSGEYHTFLDVIEQCDTVNKGDYDKSIPMAEDAFLQAGKHIRIQYETHVAIVAILGRKESRCSMVLRAANRSTTFNYNIKPADKSKKLNVAQGLGTAADFIEGVQMAYLIGVHNEKLRQELVEQYSDEDKQAVEARKRLAQIDSLIDSMENRFKVRYRPERPNFEQMIVMSEEFAKEHLINEGEEYIS